MSFLSGVLFKIKKYINYKIQKTQCLQKKPLDLSPPSMLKNSRKKTFSKIFEI